MANIDSIYAELLQTKQLVQSLVTQMSSMQQTQLKLIEKIDSMEERKAAPVMQKKTTAPMPKQPQSQVSKAIAPVMTSTHRSSEQSNMSME